MRRLTISIEEDLVKLAQAEVRSGRASSISAWVADAIRSKAHARRELIADLEDLERRDPTPDALVKSMARSLGLSKTAVVASLKAGSSKSKASKVA